MISWVWLNAIVIQFVKRRLSGSTLPIWLKTLLCKMLLKQPPTLLSQMVCLWNFWYMASSLQSDFLATLRLHQCNSFLLPSKWPLRNGLNSFLVGKYLGHFKHEISNYNTCWWYTNWFPCCNIQDSWKGVHRTIQSVSSVYWSVYFVQNLMYCQNTGLQRRNLMSMMKNWKLFTLNSLCLELSQCLRMK